MASMTFLRRFLVLIAFAFWQGGFTFYASVVVHIGLHVDRQVQSEITKYVSIYLNIIGAIALTVLAWDLLPVDPSAWRRGIRLVMWSVMLLMLGALIGVHVQLMREFSKPIHDLYLWASTVQWGAGLVYLALTVLAWRAQDRLWK
jgi:hypothetical protein